jgi:hypothetical protein
LWSSDQGKIPRQQFLDAVNWVISDAREHLAEISFRIEAVQFRRAN